MGLTLRVRLILLCAALLTAACGPIFLWLPRRLDTLSREWMESRAEGIALALAGAAEAPLDFDDRVAAAAMLEGLARTRGASYAVVVGADGDRLATWGSVPPGRLDVGATAESGERLRYQGGLLHVTAPIRTRAGVHGDLIVGFALNELEGRVRKARMLVGGLAAAILVAGLVGAWFIGTLLVRPLARMTDVARRIAAGDEAAARDLPAATRDESGAMAGALAFMLEELGRQRAQVAEMNRELTGRFEERSAELARTAAALEELRRTQEQLVVADRRISVGLLAAGVGHEINNPLAYISANVGWLQGELKTLREGLAAPRAGASEEVVPIVSEMGDALAEIEDGVTRVALIVRQLHLFSRGAEDDAVEPISLGAAMNAAVAMAGHEIRHRARLFRVDDPAPLVRANSVRLAQVLVNLLVNAAQALPESAEGCEIRAHTGTDSRGWALAEVSDTGCGIPPEHIGKLFNPFFTTKPVGKGTGLGLSISRGIVTALGGEIQVESEPGRGSTFRVLLPPCEVAACDVSSSAACPTWRKPEEPAGTRVLVVDDDPLVATALVRQLSRWYEPSAAGSGHAAIKRIVGGETFDAILCDLMMPGMSGMDVYEELSAVAPGQAHRMIFFTGGALSDAGQRFLDEHRGRWVRKPVEIAELRRIIDAC